MKRKEETNSIIEICPIRNVVARFGDKWSLLVLLEIDGQGTVRFNELGRLIPDISTRVLSGTLKTLEADGLIDRKVYAQVPPKVEYTLTDTGKSLIPLIMQLTEWALKNMKGVMNHRKEYEKAAMTR
ncbi:MAG: helix-turn-helix transcriptional regulator [Duncaniella sp.]|uniref:winged helix-turn-helix transcriptional regulator n=1 Tax=Duncaniella sp. TaxID=2518496 RepID=UPI0023BEB51E|nr:helix-turn-helix domain-containing protein [Duncaniella sp.]MDE5989448.1 helix-turn-helix transcriptional regulator [Duncaniella sp.]